MVLTDFDELGQVCKEWGIEDPELFASMQVCTSARVCLYVCVCLCVCVFVCLCDAGRALLSKWLRCPLTSIRALWLRFSSLLQLFRPFRANKQAVHVAKVTRKVHQIACFS